ncbi:tetratricopeptide repeat-containing sensor histidine kinase [Gaoshiqia sp. Z1-71]|uniref:tetratricopeptide repeat-containing sensor histidine kinase n=1 Tax=Gaoshiqia hydrogeniformans TaxID=3290090 RepID=UPI003BF84567
MYKQLVLTFLIFSGLGLKNVNGFISSTAGTDHMRIDEMVQELELLIARDLDSALVFSKKILEDSQQINYLSGAWEAMLLQGKIYAAIGKTDSSLLVLNQVLNLSREHENHILELKALIGLATTFQKNFNFESAIVNLIQAETILRDNDPLDLRLQTLNQLGIVHRKLKNYPAAEGYFNQLEESFFFQLSEEQRFGLYMNKGNVYADQKKFDETEAYFNKAYAEVKKTDHPENLALISYNLGALYYRKKDYGKSQSLVLEALQAYRKIGSLQYIEGCYRVLGAINYDQEKYREAENYYQKALGIAREINNPKSILGNYKNLYLNNLKLAEQTGRVGYYANTVEYQSKWSALKDSLYNAEMADKILELEKKYETEKKNSQISLLEKENQIKADELIIKRSQQNMLLILIGFILVILFVFIYAYIYAKRINKLLQEQSRKILSQQSQIQHQNEKLQKSVNTQNKLFSIIAHDLRSPLITVSNFSKLINFYLKDNRFDSVKEMAKQMDQKNDHVLELTDNLLSWAKSQSDSLTPVLEKISINEVIDESLDIYESVAGNKEISLVYAEQEDCLLWTDRNMLKTICRNLMNNAIKFTPRYGTVELYVEKQDKFAKICIKDTGIGMSENVMDSLFDMGASKETHTGTEGEKCTGLGLSVCKEFTETLGGQISVQSEPGKGSLFGVTVPLFDPLLLADSIPEPPETDPIPVFQT